jgi:hypothetical protein
MTAAWRGTWCVAIAAGWATMLSAQAPEMKKESDERIAVIGCIERATPAGQQAAATSAAPQFVLTHTSPGMMPASGDQKAAGAAKPAIAERYRLDGSDSMLGPYVNRKVEVTGTPSGMGASATVTISAVMKLADTCP